MKYYILLLLILFSSYKSFSQSPVEEELGSWFALSGNYKLSDKISVSSLILAWDYEIADNFNFILYNVGLNYKVSPKVTTTLAYGYADIDSGFEKSGPHTYENRLTEQISYKHELFKLPVDHRFRVEQRFLDQPSTNVLNNRLRYRLGTKIRLNETFFLRLHNEFFVTVQTKKNEGFSENRLFTGLGINVSKSTNIQVGYLNRQIRKLDLHRILLGLYYKIDFSKNKIK